MINKTITIIIIIIITRKKFKLFFFRIKTTPSFVSSPVSNMYDLSQNFSSQRQIP